MENQEEMELHELADMLARSMAVDPSAPDAVREWAKTVVEINPLHNLVVELLEFSDQLCRAEDRAELGELRTYVRLVAQGIREYLAQARKDGAP